MAKKPPVVITRGEKMKTAWILGGASGLGWELTQEAERQGITPVILGRSAPSGFQGLHMDVDLADRISVPALCQLIDCLDDDSIRSVSFFVWNAFLLEYSTLEEMQDLDRMHNINVLSPTKILQSFVGRKKELRSPFHLIAICSVASWKARPKMAVYCGSKAYQAQFSRALSLELANDLPGSKVTLIHPAGMRTGLFPVSVDTSEFLDPKEVAEIAWRKALAQEKPYDWLNILRQRNKPIVSVKNFAPELANEELPGYNRGSSSTTGGDNT